MCRKNSSGVSKRVLSQTILKIILDSRTDNDFISFNIEKISPIALHQNYHGIRASLSARIKKTRTPLLLDLGVGDIVKPGAIRRCFTPILPDQHAPSVLTYTLESTIAEKFDAIIRWLSLSTRMKDFFDIYYLCTHYEFEGSILCDAIRGTLSYRHTSLDSTTLDAFNTLAVQSTMERKWEAFLCELGFLTVSFEEAMRQIISFLHPVTISIIQDTMFAEQWTPNTGWTAAHPRHTPLPAPNPPPPHLRF